MLKIVDTPEGKKFNGAVYCGHCANELIYGIFDNHMLIEPCETCFEDERESGREEGHKQSYNALKWINEYKKENK